MRDTNWTKALIADRALGATLAVCVVFFAGTARIYQQHDGSHLLESTDRNAAVVLHQATLWGY